MQAIIDALNSQAPDAAERVIEAGFGVMRYAYSLVENPFLEETLENFQPAISRTYGWRWIISAKLPKPVPSSETWPMRP